MTELSTFFGRQIFWMALIAGACLIAAWMTRRVRPGPLGISVPFLILAIGAALAIAVATLTSQGGAVFHGKPQLEPLHTIHSYWWSRDKQVLLLYLAGNIALFAPFGFCLALAVRRGLIVGTFVSALLVAAYSVFIEIMQLPIWTRTADIDDVLLNTVGGTAGAVVGSIGLWLWNRRAPRQPAERAVQLASLSRHAA